MFRKGGPVNDGIMTGLVDRSQYAGGGTIGGGTIQGTPMGYRTGFQNPLAEKARSALQTGNVKGTTGTVAKTPAKTLESNIASKFRNLARWARKPNTGITGWLMRNFPQTFRVGAYGAPVYGALKGSGAQLELIQEAADKGLLDEYGESVEFADGRILPSSEFAEKVRPSEYTVKSGIFDKGPVTGVDEPPGGTQLPFYKRPDKEGTGGLDDIKIKETLADKRSRLNKRAKEFMDILSPEAQKRALIDSAAAASEAFGQSTGDTKQDIANAITAAAKGMGGSQELVLMAKKLAIQEDIERGLKKETKDSVFAEKTKAYMEAYPRAEGESMADYKGRILGMVKERADDDWRALKLKYVNQFGKTQGPKIFVRDYYADKKDFGGILGEDTPEDGLKYYSSDDDRWVIYKGGEPSFTTPPGA